MSYCRFKSVILVIVFPILILSACSKSHNWPQFRGPEGNMIATEKESYDNFQSAENEINFHLSSINSSKILILFF